MISEEESKILVHAGALWARFSERISKLPTQRKEDFLADLETAMENRLKVMEKVKE